MNTAVLEKSASPPAEAPAPLSGELILPGQPVTTPTSGSGLPALVPPRKRPRTWLLLLLVAAIGGIGAASYWWFGRAPALPPGIAVANGRLEAEEIDISTKFAGRVAEILVKEGDAVQVGQVVARMDTRDLEASLRKEQAQLEADERIIAEARANQQQQRAQVTLAQAEFERTKSLLQRGFATRELYDQRQQALQGAEAQLSAAGERVSQAERTRDAAQHGIDYLKVNIADNTLVAPRPGRIQYRVSNIGEVLAAGGKVFTMLDVTDVYMDVFLPTAEAGRAAFGTEARIVLDSYPTIAIPAHVSFIATQAQFTPKAVETKTERDKLMFRVKLRVDPDILAAHAAEVRSGLPGLGYVKLDPKVEWPERLRGPARP